MKYNVGKTDRAFRIFAGISLIAAGLYFDTWFWAVGIVLLLTGAFRWCPLYRIVGAKTCEAPQKRS